MGLKTPRREATALARNIRCDGGKWLKGRRILVGLSQRELAERVAAKTVTFISQVETGRSMVMPEDYLTWAVALNMRPREFVRGIMQYYSPVTYEILFGNASGSPGSPETPAQLNPVAEDRVKNSGHDEIYEELVVLLAGH
jgi:transcriptional regulator with XRE-family HTH domain